MELKQKFQNNTVLQAFIKVQVKETTEQKLQPVVVWLL